MSMSSINGSINTLATDPIYIFTDKLAFVIRNAYLNKLILLLLLLS
jgi:hypothetical protein